MTIRDLVDEARWCGHTPPLVIGRGAGRRLSDLVECPADRVLLVASQGTVRRVTGAALLLGDGAVGYHDMRPNPTTGQALALAEAIDAVRPKVVVAVGGGSAIDLAKAGRLLPPVRAGLRAALNGHGLRPEPPRLIAVPTTAGTGSEVTPFATLYHDGRKVSLDVPGVRPDHAVLDGALVTSCPPWVAMAAALDALCHAVESSWNRHATTASRQYATAAADAMVRCLTRQTADLRQEDGERRLLAATVAGVAIAHTRTTAAHAFSYWLTARRGMAHGFACAINLIWLARYNWECRRQGDRGLERVLRRLGCHPEAEPDSPVATVARCVAEAGADGMFEAPLLREEELAEYLDAGLGVRGRTERNPVDLNRDLVREHIVVSGLVSSARNRGGNSGAQAAPGGVVVVVGTTAVPAPPPPCQTPPGSPDLSTEFQAQDTSSIRTPVSERRRPMNSTPVRQSACAALRAGDSRNVRILSLCSDILTAPEWRDHGAVLLSDIPVADTGDAATAIRTVSEALGVLLPQDGAGQTLREVRYRGVSIGEGASGRYSDSREGRQWHTDGPHRPGRPPEIFALLCVRQAPVGGALVLIDGDRVVSALDQDTIEVLGQPFYFDQRQQGTTPVPRPVLRRFNGHWRFAYLRHYIELGHQQTGVPALTAGQSAALDRLDAVVDRLADTEDGHQRITLRPGELIIVDNRRVLHGRTEFTDEHPDHGRLMLRTWIRWGFRSHQSTLAG